MLEQYLEQLANLVERVFLSSGIVVRVVGGHVTPSRIRMQLTTTYDTPPERVLKMAPRLSMALGKEVSLEMRDGRLELELERDERPVLRLSRCLTNFPRRRGYYALLGMDEEGAILCLNMASPIVPHVLVAGTTGSGKTTLLRTMVLSLAHFIPPSRLQFIMIDYQEDGLGPVASLPHMMFPLVGTGILERDEFLAVCRDVLYRLNEHVVWRAKHPNPSRPRIVVVVDELQELAVKQGCRDALARLLGIGRKAGVNVVAATQRPSTDVVSGLIKANFPVRVVGSVSSRYDAEVAAGRPDSGAERLRGPGEFVLVAGGKLVPFTAAYPDVRIEPAGSSCPYWEVEAPPPGSARIGPGRPRKPLDSRLLGLVVARLRERGEIGEGEVVALAREHGLALPSRVPRKDGTTRAGEYIEEARRICGIGENR